MPLSNFLGNIPTVTSLNSAETATEDNLDSTLGHSQTDNTARMCNLLVRPRKPHSLWESTLERAEKITRWEFVDMAELLPEFWSAILPKGAVSPPGTKQGVLQHKRAITDIATWVQCFTYVDLCAVYPTLSSGP